jgi:hypothetical protein
MNCRKSGFGGLFLKIFLCVISFVGWISGSIAAAGWCNCKLTCTGKDGSVTNATYHQENSCPTNGKTIIVPTSNSATGNLACTINSCVMSTQSK